MPVHQYPAPREPLLCPEWLHARKAEHKTPVDGPSTSQILNRCASSNAGFLLQ